jgi:SAM-dependent methyltransferase
MTVGVPDGMRPDGPDNHPRMAELYDLENGWGDADDFFLAFVNRCTASRVADVGSGTGTFAIAAAQEGHAVTAVEPNPAFLDAARSKPGAERVTWIQGTAANLRANAFDTVVMTGHVAQAFIADEEWEGLLADLKRALVPGGTLAFDSRDPDVRGWEAWIGGWSGEFGDGGGFETKAEVKAVVGDVVTFEVETVLPDGERRHGVSDYRFRSRQALVASVERYGFHVDATFGGWHQEPVGHGVGEVVVLATASRG